MIRGIRGEKNEGHGLKSGFRYGQPTGAAAFIGAQLHLRLLLHRRNAKNTFRFQGLDPGN